MNKRLLLTSQGIPKELEQVFLSHLPKPANELRVSFVTTAAYGDDDNPTWLEHYRMQLRSYGIKHIEDIEKQDELLTTVDR